MSHLSGRINNNLRSLIRTNLAHGEVTCSPLGSLSWILDSSTDWVSVDMLELSNPKGEFFYCINGKWYGSSHKFYEQLHWHPWILDDAWRTWDCFLCQVDGNDVSLSVFLHK